ncbi:MAG: DUF3857 domain-containing protein [Candidatus Marinimicrobia bacterium]|nr:DUF3857 domain-containing protein [Candidatus Neomarinimicrobiota bacterium]
MKFRNQLLFAYTAIILTTCLSCGPASFFSDHWNKAEPEFLQRMTSPYENSADAVIMFDLEKVYVDKQEWDVIREHHVRIQIFTEAGKEYANIRIPFWNDDRVSNIKAQTILPDGRRIPLQQADIFEEGDEETWLYKVFTLPGVEEHCIIEYQYKYNDNSIAVLQPKYFQSRLYTEYCEFSMTLPQGFEYTALPRNTPDNYSAPEATEILTPDRKTLKKYTWVVHDLEPIKDEPYMYNREDHLFSILIQMVSYRDQFNNITFIKEWEDMNDLILEEYDPYMGSSGLLKKLLTEVVPSDSTTGVEARDLFLFVRDKITLSEFKHFWPDPMYNVIKAKTANRVEKNLLLMALLRQAGFTADPVLISRRSNGKISTLAPALADFNHLIVQLQQGGKSTLLDASSAYSTFELMPADNYSGIGLLVAEGEALLVSFPMDPAPSTRDVLTTCKLDESGSLKGSFQIRSTAQFAYSLRRDFADAKDEMTFAYDDIVDHIPGIIVDSVRFDMNMDDMRKPVELMIYFQIPDYFSPAENLTYLTTCFYQGFRANRLVSEKRHHPIEFNSTFRIKEIVNMELPDGFEVIESPEYCGITGPGITFQKVVKPQGGWVQISWNHQLNKLFQPPNQYEALRDFYSEAIAADKAVVVAEIKR